MIVHPLAWPGLLIGRIIETLVAMIKRIRANREEKKEEKFICKHRQNNDDDNKDEMNANSYI